MPPPKSALGGAMAPFAPPLWTPLGSVYIQYTYLIHVGRGAEADLTVGVQSLDSVLDRLLSL